MKDLRADLKDLHRALAQTPATDGGRTVMFISARSGEGVSSVAAAFALLAAEQARRGQVQPGNVPGQQQQQGRPGDQQVEAPAAALQPCALQG